MWYTLVVFQRATWSEKGTLCFFTRKQFILPKGRLCKTLSNWHAVRLRFPVSSASCMQYVVIYILIGSFKPPGNNMKDGWSWKERKEWGCIRDACAHRTWTRLHSCFLIFFSLGPGTSPPHHTILLTGRETKAQNVYEFYQESHRYSWMILEFTAIETIGSQVPLRSHRSGG